MALFQSDNLRVERDADGSYSLTLDVPGRAVNVLTAGVLADLSGALDVLAAQPRIPVLVVTSGKKSGFLAGADLASFLELPATENGGEAAARALSEQGQRLFDRLAALPGPSIAAIAGPCLGGGLELALACDYRLVVDRPGTQLGLPEVELGLLPAWGGTQRLPRIVGLERALAVILAGQRLDARRAHEWGLADALARTEDDLRRELAALVGRALAGGKRRLPASPLRTWRQTWLESTGLGRRVLFRAAQRRLQQRVPDDMPAPAEALEAVRVGLAEGLSAGLAQERAAAGRLAISPACRNLVTLFFQREQARKVAPGPTPRALAVVGAGVMGAGIAQLAALRGCTVAVQEVNAAALAAGLARIDGLFRKGVERGALGPAAATRARQAITGTTTYARFATAEVVVEAAVEDLTLKQDLFRTLAGQTGPDAILATNTSSLRVADLQSGLANPGRSAGLHFFNPVHKMPLVEVVRGPDTSPDVIDRLTRLVVELGKTPVVVGDGPGFVVNRVLFPYLNEAVLLAAEGMGVAEIDAVMTRFGMPVGPLELLDQIGLDVADHVARAIAPAFAGRLLPNPAFEQLRQRGWLGQKSGTGFYRHDSERPTVNPDAETILRAGGTPSPLPKEVRRADARERLVLLMVNEAVRVLEEGLAGADAVDLALVLGTGWAPHRGGPLRYAEARGPADVTRALEALEARLGTRFGPAGLLRTRAASGEGFRSSR